MEGVLISKLSNVFIKLCPGILDEFWIGEKPPSKGYKKPLGGSIGPSSGNPIS